MQPERPKPSRTLWILVLVVCAASALGALAWKAGALGPRGHALPSPSDESGAAMPGIAVIELFTSQGCSSCPPADRLLSEIAADPELEARVFPLSFHVDYWNRLGWRDPFSSPRWSERQGRYAAALDSSVYTPQVVVNGGSECVGSRRGQVVERIRTALTVEPAARVELSLHPEASAPGRWVATVSARWRAGAETEIELPAKAEIWAALWQDGRLTEVTRGENADRQLANDRVVRRLEKVAVLTAGGEQADGRLVLAADESWGAGGLGVVAFVQDPRTLEIFGAAAARPPATPQG